MGNMYTDLERSIWKHLSDTLAASGVINTEVLNIHDDLTFPSQKQVIRFAKVYDLPNDDAPRGPGSEILTPIPAPLGNIVSYDRQEWPEGYKVNYKFNCCAETIEVVREMETALHRAFRPKHPVYLYDSSTNELTTSYCDISYRGFLNQDNLDLGFFSRATIIQFEVYDYDPAITSIPAIQSVGVAITTDSSVTPDVDILITQ